MSHYISDSLRSLVAKRAQHVCEYCLISEEDTFHTFHIDHIISIKHGGPTEEGNLAFACQICNRNKGSDVGTFLFDTKEFVRFYNPRTDNWKEHFHIEDGHILPKTLIGQATVKILDFNNLQLVINRQLLTEAKRYPPGV
jgi:hypothetical protein